MISPPVCRYVSKTATSTRLDFDYDGPSMKTTVPGPRSQVIHTRTHTDRGPQQDQDTTFSQTCVNIFMHAGSSETTGRHPSEFVSMPVYYCNLHLSLCQFILEKSKCISYVHKFVIKCDLIVMLANKVYIHDHYSIMSGKRLSPSVMSFCGALGAILTRVPLPKLSMLVDHFHNC